MNNYLLDKILSELKHRDVTVRHIRNYDRGGQLNPKGGMTIVAIATPDIGVVVGVAKCNSKDIYNRRVGRTIAKVRAVEDWIHCRERKDEYHKKSHKH